MKQSNVARIRPIRWIIYGISAFVVLTAWQGWNIRNEYNAARVEAVQRWGSTSVARMSLVEDYMQACENEKPKPREEGKPPAGPLTFKECAALLVRQPGVSAQESANLLQVIDRSTDNVQAPIPLRWL